ncbi:hypothetical protein GWN65_00960 [Candidatus Bathyarchaeota archaeon]|nr:hypothetical protein [Candidatus Bathyarchaeota archaeon]NIV43521.1 hypothetical protein [Candidatus Bathyarchaeota archaeon]
MAKVKKWIESRKAEHESEEYVKTKQEFTMAIGKPFITIKVEIPEGFENFHTEFLHLEKDTLFQAEVADLVRKRLIYETRYGKPES